MNARTPFHHLPAPQQAAILCNDPRFQGFAAQRLGLPAKRITASAAAEYLRQCCGVASRRDLATSKAARTRFEMLRTEYDAWRGRIASPH